MLWTLALLAACKGTPSEVPPTPVPQDVDGDGVTAEEGDCNDFNGAILPGADDFLGDGVDQDCDGQDGTDRDGDGFLDALLGGDDCDDASADIFPGATEICNGIDDDCDHLLDDQDPDRVGDTTFFEDVDGDGFGGTDALETVSCEAPEGFVLDATDCDDGSASVHPGGEEICNGLDDDCDGLIDVDDPDYAGVTDTYYADADGDGYGDPNAGFIACRMNPGSLLDNTDCDDTDASYHEMVDWYADEDGDGSRGASLGASCLPPVASSVLISAPEDCDDTDGSVQIETEWREDSDLDGVGGGAVFLSCGAPSGAVSAALGEDCQDSDPTVFPGADDRCDDTIDHDCDGQTCVPRHCAEVRIMDPYADSGVYAMAPEGDGVLRDLYCDMSTDGGGWTLVANADRAPFDRGMNYGIFLGDFTPDSTVAIYRGLDEALDVNSDIRFSCKTDLAALDWTVDLSFYDTHWYNEVVAGDDGDSCFNEGPGDGYDQPAPARRDVLTGGYRPSGDDWDRGYLQGEETCTGASFVVDFDNGGLGVVDATRWGRDGTVSTCGLGTGAQFAVWVRPASGSAFDRDGDGQTFPGAGVGSEDDCDDGDPLVGDGFRELCDGIDNDCDGLVDSVDPDVTMVFDSVITTDTLFSGPNTYCLPPGGLTIQAGVNLTFNQGAGLSYGDIEVLGELELFAFDFNRNDVHGLNVGGSGFLSSTGTNLYASDLSVDGGVFLSGGDLFDSTVSGPAISVRHSVVRDTSFVLGEGSEFRDNQVEGLEEAIVLEGVGSSFTLTNNNFLHSAGAFFDLFAATGAVDLSGNWWGSIDPLVVSESILDSTDGGPATAGTAFVQPMLMEPTATAP